MCPIDDKNEQKAQHHLRQLAHDIQHCLHVIGMATEVLKGLREDAEKFAEVCDSIDKERCEAAELVGELVRAANHGER